MVELVKKWQNDVSKWCHTSETGHMKIPVFSKCLSDYDDQLKPWSKFHKKQVKVLKTAQMSKKMLFSLISYIKYLYRGVFAENGYLTYCHPLKMG